MKVIDRYIIRTFLINFFVLLCVLMTLVVLVDFIGNVDEFIKGGRARADAYGSVFLGTIVTIVGYYGPQMVRLYVYFSGLIVVAAMGFTFTAMHRSREVIALIASGISMYRIAAPVFVVGVALNSLTLPAQEFVIPPLASLLVRSKSHLDQTAVERFTVPYTPDERHNLLAAAEYDDDTHELIGVTITERNDERLATRRITADRAHWNPEQQAWDLTRGEATYPQQGGMMQQAPESVASFHTSLSPRVLLARQESSYKQLLSLRDLQDLRRNRAIPPREDAVIRQIIWGRFSLLVLNVLILVMGLPFFLLLSPRNVLVQAIKAAGVCLGAWGLGITLMQVPVEVLPPAAAAWLPSAVFLVVAIALLQWLET